MASKKLIAYLIIGVFIILSAFIFFNNREKKPIRGISEGAKTVLEFNRDINLKKIRLADDQAEYAFSAGEVFRNREKLDLATDGERIERVLRLTLFCQWMKEDPLLFSATGDPQKLKMAVERLAKEQDEFLKENNWQDHVFAADFLKSFIAASEQYEKLKENISEENAQALIKSVEETSNAYSHEAANLEKIFSASGGEAKYAGLSGDTYTTFGIMAGDLKKITDNSQILASEIESRKKCFNESAEFCRRTMLEAKEPELKAENKSIPNFLSKEELNFQDNINYFGPYAVNSPCWQNKDTQYLYVSNECSATLGYCLQESHLATNAYYQKLMDFLPQHRGMFEQGAEFVPQTSTSPYACNNQEYQPNLAEINYFYKNYKGNRLFEKIASQNFENLSPDFKEIINVGKKAEDTFFNAKYPSEDKLEYLAAYYAYAYAQAVKNNYADSANKEELLKRYLMLEEKMADFDLLSNNVLFFFNSLHKKYGTLQEQRNAGKSFVYGFRSSYSIFFLNFSPFIWRSPEKLEYLTNKIEGTDQKKNSGSVIDREEAIQRFGEEKIKQWQKISNDNEGRLKFSAEPEN